MDGLVLSSESITVSLGGKTILENVNLSLSSNETLGIIGPNGVGKTTLLKTLAGIIKPTEGRVRVNHKAFLVPQSDMLLPWKRLKDNILLAHPNPREENATRKLEEVARMLDMKEHLDKYPRHVSGGTRRKAAIARALLSGARILLFDEPFTGLDVTTIAALSKYLLQLKKRGYPMIIVSHQLAELSALSDRVLIMGGRPGRIVEEINLEGITSPVERHEVVRSRLEKTLLGRQVEL